MALVLIAFSTFFAIMASWTMFRLLGNTSMLFGYLFRLIHNEINRLFTIINSDAMYKMLCKSTANER